MAFRAKGGARPDRTCAVCDVLYPAGGFAAHRAANPTRHPAYRSNTAERACRVCGGTYRPGTYDRHRARHAEIPQVCATCGVQFVGTVRSHTSVCLPTRIWVRRPEILDMERARRDGESLARIGARFGVTGQRVDQLLRVLAAQRRAARRGGLTI